jgi:hypothetical protein
MKRIEINIGDRFGSLEVKEELPIQHYKNGSKYRAFLCQCN